MARLQVALHLHKEEPRESTNTSPELDFSRPETPSITFNPSWMSDLYSWLQIQAAKSLEILFHKQPATAPVPQVDLSSMTHLLTTYPLTLSQIELRPAQLLENLHKSSPLLERISVIVSFSGEVKVNSVDIVKNKCNREGGEHISTAFVSL
ncbi:hypothetical protein BDN72DRAFT_904259 [Pluteus cervinus]|uniref:Uncharacterized protein n=1 Tax=Pluteus cervinus TaxID=181527 RepID=A0ACD3A6E2_9AGAR|nr:hypothetical protein BDN72DRAFT_904259 [Pluteus cervinus]